MTHESASPLVGFREVQRRYGAGRSKRALQVWLWRNIKAGHFPAPLVISPNSRAWTEASLAGWEASLRPVGYAPQPAPTSPEAARPVGTHGDARG